MEIDSPFSMIVIGLACFFFARMILLRFVTRHLQKKIVEDQYEYVLTSPEFRVKGKYE
ncbi:MAG TPA: hypothetical protein VK158_05335 [Acidobacteriota bacterium]|nr:hypothetical protein [Acidobacteriota bacterium]